MKKLLAILLVGAAGMSTAVANDDTDTVRSAQSKAAADYKTARAQCDSMKGNAKTVCVDEARAARAHAEADALASDTSSSARSRNKAKVAAADADYALARARCNDKSGADKTSCMNEAKSSHTTALADARSTRQAETTTSDSRTSTSGTSGTAGTMGSSGTAGTATGTAGTAGDRSDTQGSGRSSQSRTGEVMADTTITTKVKADLVKESDMPSTSIHVETVKGVVMLSGFVNTKAQADRAVELARSVDGVKKVESTLKVK